MYCVSRPHWSRSCANITHARLERQLLAAQRWQEHHLVVSTSVGTPRRGSNLWLSWKRLLKRAGLPDYRFHEPRHTAASLALAEGANLFHVSRMLGHSSISITADTHGHWTDEGRIDVAQRLERALIGEAKQSIRADPAAALVQLPLLSSSTTSRCRPSVRAQSQSSRR